MKLNVSDRNGRSLEYAIAQKGVEAGGFQLTSAAKEFNDRDSAKYNSIDADLQMKYDLAAQKIIRWVSSQVGPGESVLLDRLPDTSIPDIQFRTHSKSIMISVKHNHEAIKHPRPYSFAQWCGYDIYGEMDRYHRAKMAVVERDFRTQAKGFNFFRDLTPSVVLKLYEAVCRCCETSLEYWISNDPMRISDLFESLVGSGYYKVVVKTKSRLTVMVQDFRNISIPESLDVSSEGNRLKLLFNNTWGIDLRIHTASSRISTSPSQLSLKFDAQLYPETTASIPAFFI